MMPARKQALYDQRQAGATLLEAAVALALLGAIVVVFLSGLSGTSRAAMVADGATTAERLAQVNLEWTQNATYTINATQYSAAPLPASEASAGYSATVSALPLHSPDDDIQKITVTITRSGAVVFTLEGYKVFR